jgi:hypothetical protein
VNAAEADMPWDSIGDVYTGDVWGGDALSLAVKHLRLMIGPLPPGHELGVLDDSMLGVYCDFTPDQDFVRHCEDVLAEMNDSDDWKSVIWDIEAELEAAAEDETAATEAQNEPTEQA